MGARMLDERAREGREADVGFDEYTLGVESEDADGIEIELERGRVVVKDV